MVKIMKILAVIVLLLIASAILGLYRGWPRLSVGNTKQVTANRAKKVR
jgi:hypothetical protein